jgi:hypothetical protein
VQVWLDVISISSSSLFGCGSGLDVSNLAFSCYLHHKFFNRLLFRAGRSMNATPAQSPARCTSPYCNTLQFYQVDKFYSGKLNSCAALPSLSNFGKARQTSLSQFDQLYPDALANAIKIFKCSLSLG